MDGYCFAIGNLPDPIFHPKQARKTAEWIRKNMDGLRGIKPTYPNGTLLFFDTLNEAKVARNRFRATGNPCGNHIMKCERSEDWKNVTVLEPAEG